MTNPFPALQQYADSFDLDTMDKIDYIHTPYAVLQIKAVAKWKAENEGKLPAKFAEKKAFKKMLAEMPTVVDAQNFEEAVKNATECFKKDEMPGDLKSLFDMYPDMIESSNDKFWIFLNALGKFYD